MEKRPEAASPPAPATPGPRDLALRGGVMASHREGDRIRFAMDRPAAGAAELRIRSRLPSPAGLGSSRGE